MSGRNGALLDVTRENVRWAWAEGTSGPLAPAAFRNSRNSAPSRVGKPRRVADDVGVHVLGQVEADGKTARIGIGGIVRDVGKPG